MLPSVNGPSGQSATTSIKAVTLERQGNGFGFTLRHFVVYPPEVVKKGGEVGALSLLVMTSQSTCSSTVCVYMCVCVRGGNKGKDWRGHESSCCQYVFVCVCVGGQGGE